MNRSHTLTFSLCLLVLTQGCGADAIDGLSRIDDTPGCIEGDWEPCPCPGDVEGGQQCMDSSYGECQCDRLPDGGKAVASRPDQDDAGLAAQDAGELAPDAAAQVDAGAAPDAGTDETFWNECETQADCQPSPEGSLRGCVALGAFGKRCTIRCPDCALIDVPCGYDPCAELGGYCDAVVSGSPALWCVASE